MAAPACRPAPPSISCFLQASDSARFLPSASCVAGNKIDCFEIASRRRDDRSPDIICLTSSGSREPEHHIPPVVGRDTFQPLEDMMNKLAVSLMTASLLACGPVLAQSTTVQGAHDGARVGAEVGGPDASSEAAISETASLFIMSSSG
jgi:hypothetical protein